MKKNNKRKENKKTTIILSIIVVVIIGLIIIGNYLSKGHDEMQKALKKEGYTTEDKDAFYKKIVTNNTLEQFYSEMARKKETAYEEYYISKESNDFIELKMTYKDGVNTTLNIISDLKTNYVTFNYELVYESNHLILEGTDADGYNCKKIVQKNISNATVDTYCSMIQQEIMVFLQRKDELLQNTKVKEIVDRPEEEVIEE